MTKERENIAKKGWSHDIDVCILPLDNPTKRYQSGTTESSHAAVLYKHQVESRGLLLAAAISASNSGGGPAYMEEIRGGIRSKLCRI
jgi:hypothetical protein